MKTHAIGRSVVNRVSPRPSSSVGATLAIAMQQRPLP